MVPHTYPTIEGRLVLGVITDITGLNEWQDYIPVVAQTSPVASSRNTFANDGYMGVNVLSSLTGLNAWIDYIPCYVVTGRSSPFSVSPDGYISVSAEVGTLGGASLADYIINSKTPDLVADFNGSLNTGTEFYDAGGTVDSFAELITHSRAGNATMTDGYGPELVTNGTFDSDTGWTLGTGWSISGGVATAVSSSVNINQNISNQQGKILLIEFDVIMTGGTYLRAEIGSTLGANITSSGRYSTILIPSTTSGLLYIYGNNFSGTIDNVSVREVPAIKWAPHNLLTYSEDFSNVAYVKDSGVSIGTTNNLDPYAGTSATQINVTDNGRIYRDEVAIPARCATFIKAGTFSHFRVHGVFVDLVAKTAAAGTMTELDNGWFLVVNEENNITRPFQIQAYPDNTYGPHTTSGNYYIWGAHLFRSDLGGMVDNPETGDSYVPTTSSALYLPRRNHHVYNGDAWVNEGVLHESEARTNLVTYSQDFSSWPHLTRVTVASAAAAAPDGTLSADIVTATVAANSSHFIYQAGGGGYASPITFSVWAKAGTYGYFSLDIGGLSVRYAIFDLLTGTLGDVVGTGFTARMEKHSNGWYRCSITGSYSATSVNPHLLFNGNSTSYSPFFATAGTESIYLWGAQLEEGSTPSSLIPTNSATVTRAAETLTIPAANMPWPEPKTITGNLYSGADPITITGDHTFTPTIADDSTTKVVRVKWTQTINTGTRTRMRYRNAANSADVQAMTYSNGSGTFEAIIVTSAGLMWRQVETGINVNISDITFEQIDPLSVSIQMQGRMTYADTGNAELTFFDWREDSYNYIQANLRTQTTATGEVYHVQAAASVTDDVDGRSSQYTPGVFVPFNTASRHGSTFINGAVDGVALTADTTPLALPDLSATDFNLGYDYMGTISMLRVWADDLADAGIAEASEPSEVPSLQLTFDNSQTSFTIQDWEQ